MRFDLTRRAKNRLANRFTYNLFLRLLIFKVWFRLSVLAFILIVLFLGLFLPKIWTVSPRGSIPVVKISGLNLVQGWSLKRSARRQMRSGRPDLAHYSWLAAVSFNPADPDAFRGLIANLLTHPAVEPAAMKNTLNNMRWLLHLSATNAADLDLATSLLHEYQYSEFLVGLLAPLGDHLTSLQETAFLKALFRIGDMAAFRTRWEKVKAHRFLDVELPLYWAAYTVGWGKIEEAEQGRQKLADALANPASRVLASQLELVVSSKLEDCLGYENALKALQELGKDTAVDHIGYWRLLAANGRIEEAKLLAQKIEKLPTSGRQRVELIDAYCALGLTNLAEHCFKDVPPDLYQSEELRLRYAQFLAQNKKWDDLRALSWQIRSSDGVSPDIYGYSYFLEGWAEHQLGRTIPADDAFRKMNHAWVRGNPKLALTTGLLLVHIGKATAGRELLLRFEDELKGSFDYWKALFDAATGTKDAKLLLQAAKRQVEFRPDDAEAVNRYAAALLLNNSEPEMAIKLTLRILTAFPNSADARVNHSIALFLNHRTEEAAANLAMIHPNVLKLQAANSFYMASLLVQTALKHYDEAWLASDHLDLSQLFPTQLSGIEEAIKLLPPRAQARL